MLVKYVNAVNPDIDAATLWNPDAATLVYEPLYEDIDSDDTGGSAQSHDVSYGDNAPLVATLAAPPKPSMAPLNPRQPTVEPPVHLLSTKNEHTGAADTPATL